MFPFLPRKKFKMKFIIKKIRSFNIQMIPIHDIPEQEKKAIRMNELLTLTHYDSSKPHRHHYFEFFVFIEGGGVHTIDFEDFPIHANAIHIVAPGQVHHVRRGLNSKGFVFLFELDQFSQIPEIEHFLVNHTCLAVNEFKPVYQLVEKDEVRSILDRAWENYCSDKAFKSQVVHNQLSLLMLYCLQQNTGLDAENKHQGTYVSFRKLLNKEFRNLKKVKDYALKLHISEKQLNEIVQQRTGITASNLIYKQVIIEAKRLLKTGISTKEAAYELNFSDPSHFSKFFKSQTGISPTDFQNYT